MERIYKYVFKSFRTWKIPTEINTNCAESAVDRKSVV